MMEEKMKTIITIEKPTTTGTIILKITTVKFAHDDDDQDDEYRLV